MSERWKVPCNPKAAGANVIQGDKYRITILTPGLIRLEYAQDGVFEDRATQVVLNRDFAPTQFTVKESEYELEIFTERVHMIYNRQEFSSHGLQISVLGNISNYHSIWHYGEQPNDLGGTARTLDHVDGACELEHGLVSRLGYSLLDDSTSLILKEDGWVEPRRKGIEDIYFFGYGFDYLECLNDFYHLCGKTPMIPRFALGNWWSRYFDYTEDSYKELMEQFDEEKVPFTVAVVDMDWHITEVDEKYGSGWTGYTWNKDFFPDPERFMNWLHERGMQITLNLHPADGIRAFEDCYEKMAEAMGIDPASEEPVNFDITDEKFLNNYMDVVLHPDEARGVDFWWIDWQQGKNTRIEGLDPLWMLNHYHYLDNGRDGKRPLTFSRYSGPGSHRYPVGFSGDTVITWESLDFQPYFTETASNIGYGWWSHDIGGHMQGYRNEEMEARWYALGVFSPINRLHSTKDLFYSKEPWFYRDDIRRSMDNILRFRHRMLPYLYTMNYRAYSENKPLIWPMYYTHPKNQEAYEVKNQYWFGSELLVAPITTPNVKGVNRGKVSVWLPEGTYIDIFTKMTYRGGRYINMYRDLQTIPVLAKAGAILPLTEEIYGIDACRNPETMTIQVFAGANGQFAMYEDDNETCAYMKGVSAVTEFIWNWEDGQSFRILPVQGERSLLPEKRTFTLEFVGVTDAKVHVTVGGSTVAAAGSYDRKERTLRVTVPDVDGTQEVCVTFDRPLQLAANPVEEELFTLLANAEIEYLAKRRLYDLAAGGRDAGSIIGALQGLGIDADLTSAISEIIIAM